MEHTSKQARDLADSAIMTKPYLYIDSFPQYFFRKQFTRNLLLFNFRCILFKTETLNF